MSNSCLSDSLTAESNRSGSDVGLIVMTAATSILSFVIVIGNGLIIISVIIVKRLRQPANYLIVSLALSDFLVGAVVLPITIIYDVMMEWAFGSTICDLHVSFDVICCTASIMNLCMISIDRYLMITKPMTYPQKRTSKLMLIMISAAWLLSCLIILPALFGFTENVKDSSDWRQLPLSDQLAGMNELDKRTNNSYRQNYHNNIEIRINNVSNMSSTNWSQRFDLKEDYAIRKIRFRESVSDLVAQLTIKGEICGDGNDTIYEKVFEVHQGERRSYDLDSDFQSRYLNLSLQIRDGDLNVTEYQNFEIYAEKLKGKMCLISQEVWFTIYSTVGAFYIPLAVMLCMYWKIYVEASKFKTVKQIPSWSSNCSQEVGSMVGTSKKITKRISSSSRLFFDRSENNNVSKKKKEFKAESCATEWGCNEACELITLPSKKSEGETSVDNRSDYEQSNDVTIDDDTWSSVFDNCEADKRDRDCFRDDSLLSNSRKDFSFLLNIKETVIGDDDISAVEAPSKSARLSFQCGAPSNDGVNDVNSYKNGTTHSLTRDIRPNHPLGDKIFKANSFSNGCGFPTISENNVLELSTCKNQDNNFSPLSNNSSTKSGNTDLHCERALSSQQRYSIFSATTTSTRPDCKNGHAAGGSFTNSSIGHKDYRYSKARKRRGGNFSRYAHLDLARIRECLRKKAISVKQLRRRVSSAPPRERMRNVKATRTLGIIVCAFTFCWLPFFVVTLARPFACDEPESTDCMPQLLVRIVLWLGYVNSALNPLIYIGFSPDLRKTFKYLIVCKCTNVNRRLAQHEFRRAISQEKNATISSHFIEPESIM